MRCIFHVQLVHIHTLYALLNITRAPYLKEMQKSNRGINVERHFNKKNSMSTHNNLSKLHPDSPICTLCVTENLDARSLKEISLIKSIIHPTSTK